MVGESYLRYSSWWAAEDSEKDSRAVRVCRFLQYKKVPIAFKFCVLKLRIAAFPGSGHVVRASEGVS